MSYTDAPLSGASVSAWSRLGDLETTAEAVTARPLVDAGDGHPGAAINFSIRDQKFEIVLTDDDLWTLFLIPLEVQREPRYGAPFAPPPGEDDRRFRVTTQSGSEYFFDNAQMTWSRENTNAGRENILFLEGIHSGRLAAPVEPAVGNGLTFFLPGGEWVRTTPVVSVEVL